MSMRTDACNLRRRVCFKLIKQFMNSLKVAKQARATCCCTNSTFCSTTRFACRLARSQSCLTTVLIQGFVVATNLEAKARIVDLYSFPTVCDLVCADRHIRPTFVSTSICSRAFRADFLYRWLLVEPKHVVLKPYIIHKELSFHLTQHGLRNPPTIWP